MPIPLDPLVSRLAGRLDANLREAFEERAGIVEFDGQIGRSYAECLALLGVLERHPGALLGAVVLEVRREGTPLWVVTTEQEGHQRLVTSALVAHRTCDLAEIVRTRFHGIAALAPFDR